MKLTAPCVFGSLLAFFSLSWIKADDEVVLKGQGFGPCVATLRPERACSPGQHDATCPYLLHLPPLTVHLPQQFQDLEKIMQDLQKLKESVDELREMCANCTVSQTGGECGRQSGEHEKMTAGKGTREDEKNWVRVILEKNDGDFRKDCEKDKKTKKTYGDNTDDWLVQERMEDKELEEDKTNNKKEKVEKETKEMMAKNNKKTKTEAAGKNKPFDKTQMSTADPNRRAADLMTEEVAEKNHSEPERNKEDSNKENTRIYPTETRPSEEEKYIQKYTKTKETDGLNVSVNQEYKEETKKTLGDGVKVNRNNEKPEQTELTENERTIKEMGLDEKSRAIGKEIKTERVNGSGDGELSSSKTTERADFVSFSPTPQFEMRTASRGDSMDSRKVRTFTSSLPLPSFPISPLSSITDVSQSTAAGRGPTQSTGPYTAGVPGPRSFDADLSTDTLATTTVGGPGLQTVSNSASTRKLEGQLQDTFSTSTTTSTTIYQKPYMTTSSRVEDDSHGKSKTTGRQPQSEQDMHADKKPPLGTKPEAKKKQKNPPNKPDQFLSPVKKSPPRQKEKPSLQKPKANKAKLDRDSIQPKNVKPVQKRFPDNLKPNKNQKNNSLDTQKQGQPPDQDRIPSQSITFPLKSPPAVLKPTTHRPQLVNTTLSDELSSKTGGLTPKQQENHPIKSNIISNENPLPGSNSNSESKYEENVSEQDNKTPEQDVESDLKIPTGHLNQKPKQEQESNSNQKATARPDEKQNIEIIKEFKKNSFLKPNPGPNQNNTSPIKSPTLSRNFHKLNQTSKLDQAPKQNPKFKKPGTGPNINPNKNPKPRQPPQTNPKPNAPRPGPKPHSGFKPVEDKIHKAQSNRTTKPRTPYRFRPPTSPTLEPPAETIQKPNPELQPQPKLTIKSGANPTQSSRNYGTMRPTFGFVKEITEETHTPLDKSSNVSFRKAITEQPNNPIYSTEIFDDTLLPESKSNLYSTSEDEKRSQLVTSTADWDVKPTQETSTVHQNPKKIKELESAATPTPTPKHLEGLRDISGDHPLHEPKSKEESKPKMTTTSVQTTAWPTKRPTLSTNSPKMNQTSKLDQAPKQNQKFKKPGTGPNINPNKNPKPRQPPQTNPKPNAPRPGPKPHSGFKPVEDKIHKAQSNRTTKPRTPYRFRPPTRPTLEPPAETNKRVNPAVQPQPKDVNKTDPTHISWTSSDAFQNTNTNIISSTIPGSTPPSGVPKFDSTSKIALSVEKSTLATTVPSPSFKTTFTTSPDFRSETTATSGLDPLTSADSTLELRVKINQVAAFPFNSQSPTRRPADEHLKPIPRSTNRERTYKIPVRGSFKARRDCADLLILGNKRSRVYYVTPTLRYRSFQVFCDMELEGGGWTVLQRRMDGSVSFNRTWAEYRSGFGELDGGEFWLGNNMIHLLTQDRDMVLRVELEDFYGVREHAQYAYFSVASENLQYRLTVDGYTGTAGDALLFSRMHNHNNKAFTTPDKDNDGYPSGNCGAYYSSGWWFDACMAANLNGRYYTKPYKGLRDGIFWGTWPNISREFYPTNDRHSFKNVRMMIRPVGFPPP